MSNEVSSNLKGLVNVTEQFLSIVSQMKEDGKITEAEFVSLTENKTHFLASLKKSLEME